MFNRLSSIKIFHWVKFNQLTPISRYSVLKLEEIWAQSKELKHYGFYECWHSLYHRNSLLNIHILVHLSNCIFVWSLLPNLLFSYMYKEKHLLPRWTIFQEWSEHFEVTFTSFPFFFFSPQLFHFPIYCLFSHLLAKC